MLSGQGNRLIPMHSQPIERHPRLQHHGPLRWVDETGRRAGLDTGANALARDPLERRHREGNAAHAIDLRNCAGLRCGLGLAR